MKKKYWLALSAFLIFGVALKVRSLNTDMWGVQGQGAGIFYNKDVSRVDKDGNFRLYNGSVILGDIGTNPTTTQITTTSGGIISVVNGYYGVKVPFLNGSGAATAVGTLIVASTTYNSSVNYNGSFVALKATTTVLGVSDGVYASGAVGYMTVSGYALVLTTGAVTTGSLLVSTDGVNGAGAAGYTGTATGTVVVGTVIGKALTANAANTGGLILALISQQ